MLLHLLGQTGEKVHLGLVFNLPQARKELGQRVMAGCTNGLSSAYAGAPSSTISAPCVTRPPAVHSVPSALDNCNAPANDSEPVGNHI